MAKTQLLESVTEAPVKSGNRWRVIVARPGKGSSGTYSAEMFARDAEKLIPKGAHSYINHEASRNPKDMIGTYPEGAHWDAQEQAVVGELEVFSHWKTFVEEVGPHCGISLYAAGDVDEDGNVIEIFEDSYNGADLVARPGLAGSGLADKLYEAAHAASENPGAEPSAQVRKETKDMDEKAIEAINALTTQVTALVSAQATKAEEAAKIEANKPTVEEALAAYDAAVTAIEEADLVPEQVTALKAEAKTGVDITAKIAEAKATKEAIAKHLTEAGDNKGREHQATKITEQKFGAWSN